LPAKAVCQATKILGELVGDFPRVVVVCVNWCAMSFVDSLWLSLRIQWQGVGTLGYS